MPRAAAGPSSTGQPVLFAARPAGQPTGRETLPRHRGPAGQTRPAGRHRPRAGKRGAYRQRPGGALAGPLFSLLAVILLPWTVYLGITLPSRQESPHYDVAWVGFDLFLLALLAGTAYCALRRSRYLSTVAGATAALLLTDAWFDCMTTPGAQLWQSLTLCFLVELPLAGLCLWLSYHTHQIAERRILLLRRRRRRG